MISVWQLKARSSYPYLPRQARLQATRSTAWLPRSMSSSAALPFDDSKVPFAVLRSVQDVRSWRSKAFSQKEKVGFVPTMGALHAGHLELVRQSLMNTDRTVCSIFVNPAQFAPTEDLSAYPRTLESDMEKLRELNINGKTVDALFLPDVPTLYPDGIEQDVSKQRGTFVEVTGYSQEMEGQSRPTFFRGVATVVTKLFNIVQPDLAFFGQKDIQQCLILRRLQSDLHLPHPPSPQHLRIIPTVRDDDNLALSSRNAYLTPLEREAAPILYATLKAVEKLVQDAQDPVITPEAVQHAAEKAMKSFMVELDLPKECHVDITPDYIQLNDPLTLERIHNLKRGQPAVLSGAIKIGRTRLIDNLLINIDI